MSLVGYDVSSGSESEDENETPVPENPAVTSVIGIESTNSGLKLSSVLPKPKESGGSSALVSGASTSSKKRFIKITAPEIPVLDSDDSDNESESAPPKKKFQPSKTRSGLFAKLPAPMNSAPTGKHTNTSFVPYVFSKPKKDKPPATKPSTEKAVTTSKKDDQNASSNNVSTVPSIAEIRRKSANAAAKLRSEKIATKTSEDDDTDDQTPVDFFSYVENIPDSEIPEIEVPDLQPESSSTSAEEQDYSYHNANMPYSYNEQYTEPEPIAEQDERVMDANIDKFMRIQRKRNHKEEINFIDIRADDALEGNKELLLKQISEEKNMNRTSHSKKKTNAPGGMLKRKHQLSYLVHQAKAREIELKNSWAQNRLTKQQTQSKYGF